MALIFIPKPTSSYLLFIGFIIFAFIRSVIKNNLYNLAGDDVDNYDSVKTIKDSIEERYSDIICNLTAKLLIGVFLLITIIKRKIKYTNLENINENLQNQLKSLSYKDRQKSFWNKFKIIVIISTIEIISQFGYLLFIVMFMEDHVITFEQRKVFLFLDITALYIFSMIILKTHFYTHHKLSAILNLIGLLLFLSIDKNNIKTQVQKHSITNNIFFIIFLIIKYLGYSLIDVLNKVAIAQENIKPYEVLFYKGVCQIFYVILISIFVYYRTDTFNYILTIEHLTQRIIIRIIIIIFSIGRSLFLIQVIDKFSPQHLSILKVFESLFLCLFSMITQWIFQYIHQNDNDDWFKIFLEISAFVIMGISSLIHNEIIIINCFGLEKDTKYNLDVQVEEDLRESLA